MGRVERWLYRATTDLKVIFRDPFMRFFMVLPFIIIFVVFKGLPWLLEQFPEVDSYLLPIVMVCLYEITQLFSFLYAMLLIEEKEYAIDKAIQVSPIPMNNWLFQRFLIPMTITWLLSYIVLLYQPYFEVSIFQAVILSIINAYLVPIYSIIVASFSNNKVEGIVYVKVANIVLILPILHFILSTPWTRILAIIPSFHVFNGVRLIQDNETIILLLSMLLTCLYLGLVTKVFIISKSK